MLAHNSKCSSVVLIHERCRCYSKRNHIITVRVKKFCCCFEASWHRGLCVIAILTIIFGFIEYLILSNVAFRGEPSAIPSSFLFPTFTSLVNYEFWFFIILGAMLLVGVYQGNLKVIKWYPWLLLFGYVFAALFIIYVIKDGELIVRALVWSDYGMLIKSDKKREQIALASQRISFYIITILLILVLVFFTTYMIILSLSWIDKLELEIDEEKGTEHV